MYIVLWFIVKVYTCAYTLTVLVCVPTENGGEGAAFEAGVLSVLGHPPRHCAQVQDLQVSHGRQGESQFRWIFRQGRVAL